MWKFLAVAVASFFCCLAFGQDFRGQVDKFEVTEMPIRAALERLFANRSSFVMAPDLDGTVTLSLRNVSLDSALYYVLREVDGTFTYADGVYVITHSQTPERVIHWPQDTRLLLQFEGIDVQVALKSLFKSSDLKRSYTIDPALRGKVSGAHFFETFEEAASWLAEEAGGQISFISGQYQINRKTSGWRPCEDVDVKLRQDHAEIRDVLRSLFKQVNLIYAIAPDVQGKVSCDLHGPAVEVLPRLLAAVKSFYRTESGVVQILHEQEKPNPISEPHGVSKESDFIFRMLNPPPAGWVVADPPTRP